MRLIDADAIHFENAEFDTYSDYSRAFDAIDQAPTIKTFTLADIEAQYRKGLEKGLEESLEEREHIIAWLSKFCLHIDMLNEHLSDAEALEFWKKKMKEQFGWKEGEKGEQV